jgi:hypothetical protein
LQLSRVHCPHVCPLQYKDPKRGAIGVDGFGRLLGDAGRLVR